MDYNNDFSELGAFRAPHDILQSNVSVTGGERSGARSKAIPPDHKERYQKCADYEVKILSASARKFLADALNYRIEGISQDGHLKNWEGLAELMNKNFSYIKALDNREKDPTGALLKDWQTKKGSTIGQLVDYLCTLERYDILGDKEFFKLIKQSVNDNNSQSKKTEEYFKRQDEVKKPIRCMTVGDVDGKTPMIYNAFVCYEEGDEDFVMEMIRELEIRDGHSLCLDARDLLIGQVVTAELIKSRCEKTIVVLSPKFVRDDSDMCQFAMNLSHSLTPASRNSKVIPVLVQDCEIPPALCHINPVDFSRSSEHAWQWQRLSLCLADCHELLDNAERASLRHITLKTPHRSVDLRASVRASMNKGGAGIGTANATAKKTQDNDTASLNDNSSRLQSTSSSDGADGDNVDDTDGIGATPKYVNSREKVKKKDKFKFKFVKSLFSS